MSTTRSTINTLIQEGCSVSDIATALDLAPATVRYHQHRLREPRAQDDTPRMDPPPARAESTTRSRVRELLDAGVARNEIAVLLGVSKATVTYHARRLGEHIDERCARRYDWSAVQRFYDAGHTVRESSAQFGFSPASWFQAVGRGAIVPRPTALPIEELCVSGRLRGREYLKTRLLREGLKSRRCEQCGLVEWQGLAISFALHHVNGRRDDNRLENLQLLCPNCHSQTDNFAGRRRVTGEKT